jgi:serine/threonine protein kinase
MLLSRHLFASCLENKDQLEEFFKLLNDSTLASEPKFFATIERACLNKMFLPTLREALSESPLRENEAFMKSLLALSDEHPQIKTVLEQCFKESALSSLEVDTKVKIKSKKTLGSGNSAKVKHIQIHRRVHTITNNSHGIISSSRRVDDVARKVFFTNKRTNPIFNNKNELLQIGLEGPYFIKLHSVTIQESASQKCRDIDLRNLDKKMEVTISDTESLVVLDQQLVSGTTLTSFVESSACKHNKVKYLLTEQILNAIIAMHKQGVLHRDLNSENILVTQENGEYQIKVIDFGRATSIPTNNLDTTRVDRERELTAFLDNELHQLFPGISFFDLMWLRADIHRLYNKGMTTSHATPG